MISQVDDGPTDGGLLMRVAADLGLSAPAARAAILRLRREGMLNSERQGRRARYSVTEEVAAAQRRWTEHFQAGAPAWDGAFAGLLHDFPERERGRRDAFRRAARLAGYGLLRPGLLICPDDRWPQLATRFADDERGGRLLRIGLTLVVDDARTVTADLWELDALARRYRQVTEQTRCALRDVDRDAEGNGGAPALRRLHAVLRPIYDAIADDPALPAELLPDDWPAHDLGVALAAVFECLGPSALAHVRALVHETNV